MYGVPHAATHAAMGLLVWVAFALAAGLVPAQIPAARSPALALPASTADAVVSLSSVRVRSGPAGPVVVIGADGSLPSPRVGVLTSPDRIYLDFTGVTVRAFRVDGDRDALAGIRVALHSSAPLVTRVVIDLGRRVTHKVDTTRRLSGVIEVALRTADTPSPVPTAPAVRPAAPDSDAPIPTARRRDDTRKFFDRISPLVDRLEALRPVLTSIDRRTALPADALGAALSEVAGVREELRRIHPPKNGVAAHDLLISGCGLTATALSLTRKSGDGAVSWEAASAAAGALILLDRARTASARP